MLIIVTIPIIYYQNEIIMVKHMHLLLCYNLTIRILVNHAYAIF